jgi:dipeptidyl aminopeptidase/acylaminoacyl peptidase
MRASLCFIAIMAPVWLHAGVAFAQGRIERMSLLPCAAPATESSQARTFTPRESQALDRPLGYWTPGANGLPAVSYAHDSSKFVVALIAADVGRNGNWISFYSGDAKSTHKGVRCVGRLFTSASSPLALRDFSTISWLGHRIVFPWRFSNEESNLVSLDLDSGDAWSLWRGKDEIYEYSVDQTGSTVAVVTTQQTFAKSAENLIEAGGYVTSGTAWPALAGNLDGQTAWNALGAEVVGPTSTGTRSVGLGPQRLLFAPEVRLSPDGRYLLFERSPDEVSETWDRYGDARLRLAIKRRASIPGESSRLAQLWLLDLASGSSRPLWNAPSLLRTSKFEWAPDSKSIVCVSCFAPIGTEGATGERGIFVQDVETGTITNLTTLSGVYASQVSSLRWDRDAISLTLPKGQRVLLLRGSGKKPAWIARSKPPQEPAVRWSGSLNSAPYLEAAGSSPHRLLETHHGLANYAPLAHVEMFSWVGTSGTPWRGALYLPRGIESNKRYPLVIQHHPASRLDGSSFSVDGLEGSNLAFSAQALATRGIIVLQIGGGGPLPADLATYLRSERDEMLDGYSTAVEALYGRGLVDRRRVGITGWSRSGQYVLHALAERPSLFAAAIVADNSDTSYLQHVLGSSETRDEVDMMNQGSASTPDGLRMWIDRAPGFRAANIQTPLRMERYGGAPISLLGSWELFSNLRHLRRPVELFLPPGANAGAHSLERPAQVLAVQEGAVEWFAFWLKGELPDDVSRGGALVQLRDLVAATAGQ